MRRKILTGLTAAAGVLAIANLVVSGGNASYGYSDRLGHPVFQALWGPPSSSRLKWPTSPIR